MATFSQHFELGRSQGELDFVDIRLDRDTPLFLDPFALSQRTDRWSLDAHDHLKGFFQRIVELIRSGKEDQARRLLDHLQEPNETRFGLSKGRPQGAGVGTYQADQLFLALRASKAVKSGFLSALEECELMIEGIGWDKISDLTTNVIRGHLARYTLEQCDLHDVPTLEVSAGAWYSLDAQDWVTDYLKLPVAHNVPILLVPKAIARIQSSYDHRFYYRHFALAFLQTQHLEAGSNLVRSLKDGRKKVLKNDLAAAYPCSKEFLFEFSKEHPEVLAQYRDHLAALEKQGINCAVPEEDEPGLAAALRAALGSLPKGPADAAGYHRLMIGVLEFLFFPDLVCPRKEQEIHQGRKRIDIVMENAASRGPFFLLHSVKRLPCAYIAFECKNYRTEVANPELDQLCGRFSPNRGRVGFICCRTFEDRGRFVERCRDTLRDDRGLVLPLDDVTVDGWLSSIEQGRRNEVGRAMQALVAEVWMA